MAAPEKAAKTKAAAPPVQTSPAIAMQAKVNCTDRAFGTFSVCVACGGVQGGLTSAAQPPYAKMATKPERGAPLSLPC